MLDKHMRLEELLARDLTIRWFEGVALIQAVCRQLVRHDAFPTAAEIVLAADGTVATLNASGRTAVRTAAQLLARMLSDDVPVRLRLIVAQATGADTAYPALEEFSTAIAYFERPDGGQVLRALYERAMDAPARSAAAEAGNEASLINPDDARDEPAPRTRSHLRLVIGAAVTAACVLAAWLGASALDSNRVGAAFTSITGSVTTGTSRAASPARPRNPVGRVGEAEAKTAAARSARTAERGGSPNPSPAAKPAGERTNTRASAASPREPREPLNITAVLPLNSKGTVLISPTNEYRPVFGEAVEIKASDGGSAFGGGAVAGAAPPVAAFAARIYSRTDEEVTPPRSVYPKLPSDSFSEEPDNRTVLELVIGTNGLVERALLRSIPRDIHEFMLVSAAKAWIFEPATIEGLPVRYRHRVRISLP